MGEVIPYWCGNGVNTGKNLSTKPIGIIMKNFTLPFLAGVAGAFVALGVAISTPPKAEAGSIYWNNNGGGGGGVLVDAADHCPA